jgi:hypothetical protein
MKRGGEFIASGADTCVYDPPLKCVGKPNLPAGKYVSRVVREDEGEVEIQQQIKEIIDRYEAKYIGKIKPYFNLMEDACTRFQLNPSDMTNKDSGKQCGNFLRMRQPGLIMRDYVNIRTPKQMETVTRYNEEKGIRELSRPLEVTARGLYNIMRALIYTRGDFVHIDAHEGNIAWMPNGNLVLFDWGRATTERDEPLEILINSFLKEPEENTKYGQFFYNIVMVNQGITDPLRMRKIFDLLSFMYILTAYNILPEPKVTNALDTIQAIVEKRPPTVQELLDILDTLFGDMLFVTPPSTPPKMVIKHLWKSPPRPKYVVPPPPPPILSKMETSSTRSPSSKDTEMYISSVSTTEGLASDLEKLKLSGGMRQSTKFCRCIKAVRKTIKARPGSTKESGAIAVCNVSILGRRGRTLKKFRCGRKPYLKTQKKMRT